MFDSLLFDDSLTSNKLWRQYKDSTRSRGAAAYGVPASSVAAAAAVSYL